MKKTEITRLKDKDLQLRYLLGGLKLIVDGKDRQCTYLACSINCSCDPVADDENFKKVKKFLNKHNLTNERFIKLTYNYLIGSIMKYNDSFSDSDSYSPLFIELEEVIKPYNYLHINRYQIEDIGYMEDELKECIYCGVKDNNLTHDFCKKYNLTREDFMTIAKTYLNDNLYGLCLKNDDDKFLIDLKNVLVSFNLNYSKKHLDDYRSAYQLSKENTELVINIQNSQKEFLIFLRELLDKDRNLAIEILKEMFGDINLSKKEIKQLLKK